MNKYLVTARSGTITISYTPDGLLSSITGEPDLRESMMGFVQNNAMTEDMIKAWTPAPGATIRIEAMTVTFDIFWSKYPEKVGKKKSQIRWDKMKEEERQEAYRYLPRYIRQVDQRRIAYKDPLTYLNSYIWEDAQ